MSAPARRRSRFVKDRCEVCLSVLVERPDPRRRRCADHLGQWELPGIAAVVRPPVRGRWSQR